MNITKNIARIPVIIVIALSSCASPPQLFDQEAESLSSVAADNTATDLNDEWQRLIHLAKEEAKVAVPISKNGGYGGVFTTTFLQIGFILRQEGDAGLALYDACARKFGAWATVNNARTNYSDGSTGKALRIKAANGDHLCCLYTPPDSSGVHGNVTVIFGVQF